jgi:hypothetical protein
LPRAAFESRDAQIEAALDPILLEHRDMMYARVAARALSVCRRLRRAAASATGRRIDRANLQRKLRLE